MVSSTEYCSHVSITVDLTFEDMKKLIKECKGLDKEKADERVRELIEGNVDLEAHVWDDDLKEMMDEEIEEPEEINFSPITLCDGHIEFNHSPIAKITDSPNFMALLDFKNLIGDESGLSHIQGGFNL
ncbi:MAG: hypothetical protein OSB62_08975 [Alphaproteobacteria bacterium]|nr:hypothetical protein [Alphaproteobacteria bacterium]